MSHGNSYEEYEYPWSSDLTEFFLPAVVSMKIQRHCMEIKILELQEPTFARAYSQLLTRLEIEVFKVLNLPCLP